MHSVIVTMPRKVVEVVVTPLQMTSLSITRLGECLIEEYSKCGQVRIVQLVSTSISLSFTIDLLNQN